MSAADDDRMVRLGGSVGQLSFGWSDWGDMRRLTDANKKAMSEAVYFVVQGYGAELKEAWRNDVRKSGVRKASRLAGAVRGKMFPARPNGSMSPAYVIGTNAPTIFEALEEGPTIQFQGGAGLVPIGVARQIMAGFPIGRPHADIINEVKARYGGVLVSKRSKKTGMLQLGIYSAIGSAGKTRFVPLFAVVRSVQMPKLLKLKRILATYRAGLPARLAQRVPIEWARRVEAAGGIVAEPRRTVA